MALPERAADLGPLIHYLFHRSSATWQYIVADPATRHCVIIDPVLEGESGNTYSANEVSTMAADGILAEVHRQQYQVDHILETHCSRRDQRSASWYLRMQLLESQGYAPQLVSGSAVAGVHSLFMRKYKRQLDSTLAETTLQDGQPTWVGMMSIEMIQLPGLCTPNGKAYVIGGKDVFGAHTVASLKTEMQRPDFEQEYPLAKMTEDACHSMWESVQKVLAMPGERRLYFDRGLGRVGPSSPEAAKKGVHFDDGDDDDAARGREAQSRNRSRSKSKARSKVRSKAAERRQEEVPQPPRRFTTAAEFKSANKDIANTSAEFMRRWSEKRYEMFAKAARPK